MHKILDAERCGIMERFYDQGGTLDGYRAEIQGRTLAFPKVVVLNGPSISNEYSWDALRSRVNAGRVHLKSR